MALTRGKLSNVVVVGAASTAGIVTCASSKKVYVKSVLAHAGTGASTSADIYFIPNAGTATSDTRIARMDVQAGETVFFEPSYPLVLDTTGDQISVGAGASTCNFIITGDVES